MHNNSDYLSKENSYSSHYTNPHNSEEILTYIKCILHETRHPLNNMTIAVDIINKIIENDNNCLKNLAELREIVRDLKESCMFMSSSLNSFIDINNVDTNDVIQLNYSPFNLIGCIKTTEQILHQQIKKQNINIIYEYDPNIPQWVIGDSNNLKHVFINLLSNAIKHRKTKQSNNSHERREGGDLISLAGESEDFIKNEKEKCREPYYTDLQIKGMVFLLKEESLNLCSDRKVDDSEDASLKVVTDTFSNSPAYSPACSQQDVESSSSPEQCMEESPPSLRSENLRGDFDPVSVTPLNITIRINTLCKTSYHDKNEFIGCGKSVDFKGVTETVSKSPLNLSERSEDKYIELGNLSERSYKNNCVFVISIEDNNDNIPPHIKSKLFEKYNFSSPATENWSSPSLKRSEGETTTNSGLGLYITKKIVLLHGGDITHENIKPTGNKFVITIPLETCVESCKMSSTSLRSGDNVRRFSNFPANSFGRSPENWASPSLRSGESLNFSSFRSDKLRSDFVPVSVTPLNFPMLSHPPEYSPREFVERNDFHFHVAENSAEDPSSNLLKKSFLMRWRKRLNVFNESIVRNSNDFFGTVKTPKSSFSTSKGSLEDTSITPIEMKNETKT
jgi:signal transduction histidine kinase